LVDDVKIFFLGGSEPNSKILKKISHYQISYCIQINVFKKSKPNSGSGFKVARCLGVGFDLRRR